MQTTECKYTTETKLSRITWLSSRDKDKVFHQLMHHFNEESLENCFYKLDGSKASGADGVTKEQYRQELKGNIKDLVERMRRMSYRPGNVLEVQIPKEGKRNSFRQLGISNFEDKIVQKMMQRVLESIYEPLFLDCSYGFRPGRGCQDAIRALDKYVYQQPVETIIDVDLAQFFDTISHQELEKILRNKIKDEKLMRTIIRMFKAGVLSAGELRVSDNGLIQGSSCSPVLANIFAHYVIDEWFEEVVKPHCHGKVELFRYGDDSVICCQYQQDALRVKEALAKRLEKFKLTMNREKTKVISFSRRKAYQGEKQGTFDFLGFTFYLGQSRKDKIILKLKTSSKRLRSKLKKLKEWIKSVRTWKEADIWERFYMKILGHFQYFGVSHNMFRIGLFYKEALNLMFKWLNRRSQKRSYNWETFHLAVTRVYPQPKLKVYWRLFEPITE